jgi:folate-dependent phosphoribosylglycinamide formyltransferase PurN
MVERGEGAKLLRIAFCHLESLVCLPAVNRLFSDMGGSIGLVIVSNRFGSRNGGLFRQLIASIRRSGIRLTLWLGFDIIAAQIAGRVGEWIGRPPRCPQLAGVRLLAKNHNAVVLDSADINGDDVIKTLQAYAPDVVIVMNFDQVLKAEFIAAAGGKVINVHPSLLPALRGPCPVFWAFAEGRREVGVSLHMIEDEKIDAGPILVQRAQALDRKGSVAEVTAALFEEGATLLAEAVRGMQGHAGKYVQDTTLATYRSFPDRAEMARFYAGGARLCRFRPLTALLAKAIAQRASLAL